MRRYGYGEAVQHPVGTDPAFGGSAATVIAPPPSIVHGSPSLTTRNLVIGVCIAIVIVVASSAIASALRGHPTAVTQGALFGNANAGLASPKAQSTTSGVGAGSATRQQAGVATGATASSPQSALPNLSVPDGFALTSAIPNGGPELPGMSRLLTYVGPGGVAGTADALASLLHADGWKIAKHEATPDFAAYVVSAAGWTGLISVNPSGTSAGGSTVTVHLQECGKTCLE